tara:strand:- start:484 stop:687 length:204 start_codon:yes stop_codon:yes gene_type:complete
MTTAQCTGLEHGYSVIFNRSIDFAFMHKLQCPIPKCSNWTSYDPRKWPFEPFFAPQHHFFDDPAIVS